MRQKLFHWLLITLALALAGCAGANLPHPAAAPKSSAAPAIFIATVDLDDAPDLAPANGDSAVLQGAKNEWLSFGIKISAHANPIFLAIDPLIASGGASIAASHFSAYQVAPIASEPFALLPLEWQASSAGRLALHSSSEPVVLWIDLHVPPDAKAGRYTALCRLNDAADRLLASLAVELNVYDFALPTERHLQMAGLLNFDQLSRLDQAVSSAPSPRLLSRADAASASTIGLLDGLVAQAHAHRADLVFPQLQPSVKWPADQTPEIEWDDFDSLAGPWLSGRGFADQSPLAWWPIPQPDLLDSFDARRQQQYWKAAAAHFTRQNWLTPATVFLDPSGSNATVAELLAAYPLLNVTVAAPVSGLGDRVVTLADGLVSQTPPSAQSAARHWLRPELQFPTNESDVRLWAWLAFLRQADLIVWPDPSAWFHAGAEFGRSGPLISSRLLWIRRAEQDYEYLWLARQRGRQSTAAEIAGMLTRYVQVAPPLEPKASYALICGTADSQSWEDALALLARVNQPMDEAGQFAFNVDLAEWEAPRARALLLPGAIDWRASLTTPNQLTAAIGVDIYNGAGRPIGGDEDRSTISVSSEGSAWHFDAPTHDLPKIESCGIARIALPASFDLSRLANPFADEQPLRFTFLDGFTRRQWTSQIIAPIAASFRRRSPVVLDGELNDWSASDCIHDGPLIDLLDRDGIARQRTKPASTSSQLFTGWSAEDFYLAFAVGGAAPAENTTFRNFVDDSAGEKQDLCELLIEAIYPDNTLAPAIHISCQINSPSTERKAGEQWQAIDSSAIRYAGSITAAAWRGEMAIPWGALIEPGKPRPRMLRFNFTQRRHDGLGGKLGGPGG